MQRNLEFCRQNATMTADIVQVCFRITFEKNTKKQQTKGHFSFLFVATGFSDWYRCRPLLNCNSRPLISNQLLLLMWVERSQIIPHELHWWAMSRSHAQLCGYINIILSRSHRCYREVVHHSLV